MWKLTLHFYACFCGVGRVVSGVMLTSCRMFGWLGVAIAFSVTAGENPIVPDGAQLELLHTRQVKLNSGLCEGPTAAPDGTIYFTDMPFGNENGMILRFDPKARKTSVFTSNSGKSNG